MPGYRSTQKNVLALALVLKYIRSAESRATDDNGLPGTFEALASAKATIAEALVAERLTRGEGPDGTPIVTVDVAPAAAAVAADAAAEPTNVAEAADELPSGEATDAADLASIAGSVFGDDLTDGPAT